MLTLHYYPSNASITPHILLEEMGVSFALKLVDRTQAAHKSVEYLKLNPNGLIPVLIDDAVSGSHTPPLVLYETAAICLHLVDRFPEKNFAPRVGTVERAHFYKWLVWLTNTLQPALISYFYPDRYVNAGDASAAAQVRASSQLRIGAMLKQLDDQLAVSAAYGGEWLLGKQYSAVDIYAFMLGRWTRVFEGAQPATQKASSTEAWPHLGAFMHRMLGRDAVQRVVTKEALKKPFI